MMTQAHDCPATGCGRRIGRDYLMCRNHWYMVPRALRDRVWDTWANGRGAGTPAHFEAITKAVAAVNSRLRDRDARSA